MHTKFTTTSITLLSVLWLFSSLVVTPGKAEQKTEPNNSSYFIEEIKTEINADSISMVIRGSSPPAFTKYETFGPFRVVIDVAQATLAETLDKGKLLADNKIAKLTTIILAKQDPPLIRFEFQINDAAPYSVNKDGNSIVIKIEKAANQSAAETDKTYEGKPILTGLEVTTGPEQTKVLITADQSITSYNSDAVAGNSTLPDRMFIDINNVNGEALPREKNIETAALKKIRVAKRGAGIRIVFDSGLSKLFHYDITPDPMGLLVVIAKSAPEGKENTQENSVQQQDPSASTDSTLEALLASSSTAIETPTGPTGSSQSGQTVDKYDFSGYKKKKISIDFYKIDIHNIFRLLREITDINIVVDEAVNGTLTLALSDVPWDFALDIILNLTDLEKEERYNTIVIYPKKKKFNWPKRGAESLDVKVDLEIIKEEALIVQRAASQPKEIIQAKSLMRKAQQEEKHNNLEQAAKLYEQALGLWPTNYKISNKLATLYLVGLRINAKAVNYAKKSLEINPQDTKAALYAAIGMANMNRLPEAMEHFNQAVSDNPPMKDALVSYATFSENNDQPEAALKLLNTFYTYYGDTVETMMARARIYDKIGETDKATTQYKAVLNSGFQLRPDLKKFIRGRVAVKNLTTGK